MEQLNKRQDLNAQQLAHAMMTPKAEKKVIIETKQKMKYSSVEDLVAADGISHINISHKSKTQLGKKLDIFYHSPISIERDGVHEEYACLAGFMFYLRTLNAEFFKLSGKECLDKSKSEEKINTLPDNFPEIFSNLLLNRIISDVELVKDIINSDKPFNYYLTRLNRKTNTLVKTNVQYHEWYINALNRIRKALKNVKDGNYENVKVDFKNLINKR